MRKTKGMLGNRKWEIRKPKGRVFGKESRIKKALKRKKKKKKKQE